MVLAVTESWGDKLRNGFDSFFNFIPNLAAFLIILIVGYFVAKLLAALIRRLLDRTNLDETVKRGQGARYFAGSTRSPSNLLASVVFWVLMLGVLAVAFSALGIPEVTAVIAAIFAYIPNVIAALVIFVVAFVIATGISKLVNRTLGDTPTGRVVGTVAPGLVMAIAVFMILNQLQIAPTIVTITYAALLGGLALAAALAFGFGGRDVASRMLEDAYAKGQESRAQIRRDLEYGRTRARTAPADGAHPEERVRAGRVRVDERTPGARVTR
jgi:mechanosensitive ion channel-like protein